MESAPRQPRARITASLLAASCIVWLGIRFLPWSVQPAPGATAVLDGIDVIPSAATARYELVGLPDGPTTAPLLEDPQIAGALARLDARRVSVNNRLALDAAALAGQVVNLDEGAVAYWKWANVVVSFRDEQADRLARVAGDARARPLEFLRVFCSVADERLAEPARGDALDPEPLLAEAAGRRELMRRLRDASESIQLAEDRVASEVRSFRETALEALQRPPGIHRRGWGRLVEAMAAGVIGALTMACLAGRAGRLPLLVESSFAAALATAAILLLEGTPVLPVHPYLGVSRAFVPVSFALGITVALLSRLAPIREPVEEPGAIPLPERVPWRPAGGPRSERELEVGTVPPRPQVLVPQRPAPRRRESLPFFPKRTARRR